MPARTAVAAGLGAALGLAAAPAAHAATSVSVPPGCYAEGTQIPVEGAGFTPGAPVALRLERGGRVLERSTEPRAEADGTVAGDYGVAERTGFFRRGESRFRMTLRLVDRRRLRDGQPRRSPDVSAATTLLFSRWHVGVRARGGRLHPRRPARIFAAGYAESIGEPLYAHWLRGGRLVHTRRLGVLGGRCGDLRTRLARGFPFRPAPGRYRVAFNTSPTDPRATDTIVRRAARVRIP